MISCAHIDLYAITWKEQGQRESAAFFSISLCRITPGTKVHIENDACVHTTNLRVKNFNMGNVRWDI